MGIANFLVADSLTAGLGASTREGAIREMIQSLAAAGQFPGADLDDIARAVLRREQLGSTGIGRGIAIPHTRHTAVTQLIGTLATSAPGIAFDSIDGEPVHVLFLLISPQDRPAEHLRALESVVHAVGNDAFVQSLRAAATREQLVRLVESGPAS